MITQNREHLVHINQYIFPVGVERVVQQPIALAVPRLLEALNYERPFLISSGSIHSRTPLVGELRAALGDRLAGFTDAVGEHAPIPNILAAAQAVKDAKADVLISIGGGSVLDFCKFIQLAISENAFTKEALLKFEWRMSPDGHESISTSKAEPAIRQIAIPTTLATAEWTSGGTPIDPETRRKARLRAIRGAPQAIIYDPRVLTYTPSRLLFATAVRGLDHAINSYMPDNCHPLGEIILPKAIQLYVDSLRILAADRTNLQAMENLQLATWYTGMIQATMSATHGFSHWMVHVLSPHAMASHSETGGILMLAQARWIEATGAARQEFLARMLEPAGTPLSVTLERLLKDLALPTRLPEIGIDMETARETIPLALQHPMLTRHNVRAIKTANDIDTVLSYVA